MNEDSWSKGAGPISMVIGVIAALLATFCLTLVLAFIVQHPSEVIPVDTLGMVRALGSIATAFSLIALVASVVVLSWGDNGKHSALIGAVLNILVLGFFGFALLAQRMVALIPQ